MADDMAALLAEHQMRGDNSAREGKWWICCLCGEWLSPTLDPPSAWDKALAVHQAEVIEAAGYAKRRTVIEDLVAVFEARADGDWCWDAIAARKLRAELEGDGS